MPGTAPAARRRALVLALVSGLVAIAPVQALAQGGPPPRKSAAHSDQGGPSFREIERNILARMKGMEYLGPEQDPVSGAYRFKFIQNGKVHFVDVDARTGRIIAQSR